MLILPHRLIQVAVFEQLRAQLNGWLSFVCALEKQLCCNLFWTYIFKPMKTINDSRREACEAHVYANMRALNDLCLWVGTTLNISEKLSELSCCCHKPSGTKKEDGRTSWALSIRGFLFVQKVVVFWKWLYKMKPHDLWFDWHKGVTVSHEQKPLTWFTKHLQTHKHPHLSTKKRKKRHNALHPHLFSSNYKHWKSHTYRKSHVIYCHQKAVMAHCCMRTWKQVSNDILCVP